MTIHVEPAEYYRLLGYPRGSAPSERALELAGWAHDWYEHHGSPWIYERHSGVDALFPFHSERLHRTLRDADACGAVLVAVSAGPELEAEAQKLWHEEKPDEYFFLEIFGSAVVEHLIANAGARLCEWAAGHSLAVLPHYSPGYEDWDVSEQRRLLDLITPESARVEVLESGALRPKKSQLAVFGLTSHTDRVACLTELVPCRNCSFGPCQFRRAPYGDLLQPKYATNPKALHRWAAERLTLEARPGGAIDARFRYDGTTCTNMGRPLAFDYRVHLGPREEGYPILDQCCEPAPCDTGHTAMCQFIASPTQLMADIVREKPLLGHSLNDVLTWKRPPSPAGCYCEPEARNHKWGLVLETIHYALTRNGNS